MVMRRLAFLVLLSLYEVAPADNFGEKIVFNDRFQAPCLSVATPTSALRWQADTLVEGEILTLSTDGTCPFGEHGPEIIILVDLTRMAPGLIDVEKVVTCDTCEWEAGDTHEVEEVEALPGQRGLVMAPWAIR